MNVFYFYSERAHAEGSDHTVAPGLRVRGVPRGGGCRLLHQNHEHDQTVREAYQGQ